MNDETVVAAPPDEKPDFTQPSNYVENDFWRTASPDQRPELASKAFVNFEGALQADRAATFKGQGFRDGKPAEVDYPVFTPDGSYTTEGLDYLDRVKGYFETAARSPDGGVYVNPFTGKTTVNSGMESILQKNLTREQLYPAFAAWQEEKDKVVVDGKKEPDTWDNYVAFANAEKPGTVDPDNKVMRQSFDKMIERRDFNPSVMKPDEIVRKVAGDLVINPQNFSEIDKVEAAINGAEGYNVAEKRRMIIDYHRKVNAGIVDLAKQYSSAADGVMGSDLEGSVLENPILKYGNPGVAVGTSIYKIYKYLLTDEGNKTLLGDLQTHLEKGGNGVDFLRANKERMTKENYGLASELADSFRDATADVGAGALFLVGRAIDTLTQDKDNTAGKFLSIPAQEWGYLSEMSAGAYKNQTLAHIGGDKLGFDVSRRDLTQLAGQLGSMVALGGFGSSLMDGLLAKGYYETAAAGAAKAVTAEVVKKAGAELVAKSFGRKSLDFLKGAMSDPTAYFGGIQAGGMTFGQTYHQTLEQTGDENEAYKQAWMAGTSDAISATIATGMMNRFAPGAERLLGMKGVNEELGSSLIQTLRTMGKTREGLDYFRTAIKNMKASPEFISAFTQDVIKTMKNQAKQLGLRGGGPIADILSEGVEEGMDQMISDHLQVMFDESKDWDKEIWGNASQHLSLWAKSAFLGGLGGAAGASHGSTLSLAQKLFSPDIERKALVHQEILAPFQNIADNIVKFSEDPNRLVRINGDSFKIADIMGSSDIPMADKVHAITQAAMKGGSLNKVGGVTLDSKLNHRNSTNAHTAITLALLQNKPVEMEQSDGTWSQVKSTTKGNQLVLSDKRVIPTSQWHGKIRVKPDASVSSSTNTSNANTTPVPPVVNVPTAGAVASHPASAQEPSVENPSQGTSADPAPGPQPVPSHDELAKGYQKKRNDIFPAQQALFAKLALIKDPVEREQALLDDAAAVADPDNVQAAAAKYVAIKRAKDLGISVERILARTAELTPSVATEPVVVNQPAVVETQTPEASTGETQGPVTKEEKLPTLKQIQSITDEAQLQRLASMKTEIFGGLTDPKRYRADSVKSSAAGRLITLKSGPPVFESTAPSPASDTNNEPTDDHGSEEKQADAEAQEGQVLGDKSEPSGEPSSPKVSTEDEVLSAVEKVHTTEELDELAKPPVKTESLELNAANLAESLQAFHDESLPLYMMNPADVGITDETGGKWTSVNGDPELLDYTPAQGMEMPIEFGDALAVEGDENVVLVMKDIADGVYRFQRVNILRLGAQTLFGESFTSYNLDEGTVSTEVKFRDLNRLSMDWHSHLLSGAATELLPRLAALLDTSKPLDRPTLVKTISAILKVVAPALNTDMIAWEALPGTSFVNVVSTTVPGSTHRSEVIHLDPDKMLRILQDRTLFGAYQPGKGAAYDELVSLEVARQLSSWMGEEGLHVVAARIFGSEEMHEFYQGIMDLQNVKGLHFLREILDKTVAERLGKMYPDLATETGLQQAEQIAHEVMRKMYSLLVSGNHTEQQSMDSYHLVAALNADLEKGTIQKGVRTIMNLFRRYLVKIQQVLRMRWVMGKLDPNLAEMLSRLDTAAESFGLNLDVDKIKSKITVADMNRHAAAREAGRDVIGKVAARNTDALILLRKLPQIASLGVTHLDDLLKLDHASGQLSLRSNIVETLEVNELITPDELKAIQKALLELNGEKSYNLALSDAVMAWRALESARWDAPDLNRLLTNESGNDFSDPNEIRIMAEVLAGTPLKTNDRVASSLIARRMQNLIQARKDALRFNDTMALKVLRKLILDPVKHGVALFNAAADLNFELQPREKLYGQGETHEQLKSRWINTLLNVARQKIAQQPGRLGDLFQRQEQYKDMKWKEIPSTDAIARMSEQFQAIGRILKNNLDTKAKIDSMIAKLERVESAHKPDNSLIAHEDLPSYELSLLRAMKDLDLDAARDRYQRVMRWQNALETYNEQVRYLFQRAVGQNELDSREYGLVFSKVGDDADERYWNSLPALPSDSVSVGTLSHTIEDNLAPGYLGHAMGDLYLNAEHSIANQPKMVDGSWRYSVTGAMFPGSGFKDEAMERTISSNANFAGWSMAERFITLMQRENFPNNEMMKFGEGGGFNIRMIENVDSNMFARYETIEQMFPAMKFSGLLEFIKSIGEQDDKRHFAAVNGGKFARMLGTFKYELAPEVDSDPDNRIEGSITNPVNPVIRAEFGGAPGSLGRSLGDIEEVLSMYESALAPDALVTHLAGRETLAGRFAPRLRARLDEARMRMARFVEDAEKVRLEALQGPGKSFEYEANRLLNSSIANEFKRSLFLLNNDVRFTRIALNGFTGHHRMQLLRELNRTSRDAAWEGYGPEFEQVRHSNIDPGVLNVVTWNLRFFASDKRYIRLAPLRAYELLDDYNNLQYSNDRFGLYLDKLNKTRPDNADDIENRKNSVYAGANVLGIIPTDNTDNIRGNTYHKIDDLDSDNRAPLSSSMGERSNSASDSDLERETRTLDAPEQRRKRWYTSAALKIAFRSKDFGMHTTYVESVMEAERFLFDLERLGIEDLDLDNLRSVINRGLGGLFEQVKNPVLMQSLFDEFAQTHPMYFTANTEGTIPTVARTFAGLAVTARPIDSIELLRDLVQFKADKEMAYVDQTRARTPDEIADALRTMLTALPLDESSPLAKDFSAFVGSPEFEEAHRISQEQVAGEMTLDSPGDVSNRSLLTTTRTRTDTKIPFATTSAEHQFVTDEEHELIVRLALRMAHKPSMIRENERDDKGNRIWSSGLLMFDANRFWPEYGAPYASDNELVSLVVQTLPGRTLIFPPSEKDMQGSGINFGLRIFPGREGRPNVVFAPQVQTRQATRSERLAVLAQAFTLHAKANPTIGEAINDLMNQFKDSVSPIFAIDSFQKNVSQRAEALKKLADDYLKANPDNTELISKMDRARRADLKRLVRRHVNEMAMYMNSAKVFTETAWTEGTNDIHLGRRTQSTDPKGLDISLLDSESRTSQHNILVFAQLLTDPDLKLLFDRVMLGTPQLADDNLSLLEVRHLWDATKVALDTERGLYNNDVNESTGESPEVLNTDNAHADDDYESIVDEIERLLSITDENSGRPNADRLEELVGRRAEMEAKLNREVDPDNPYLAELTGFEPTQDSINALLYGRVDDRFDMARPSEALRSALDLNQTEFSRYYIQPTDIMLFNTLSKVFSLAKAHPRAISDNPRFITANRDLLRKSDDPLSGPILQNEAAFNAQTAGTWRDIENPRNSDNNTMMSMIFRGNRTRSFSTAFIALAPQVNARIQVAAAAAVAKASRVTSDNPRGELLPYPYGVKTLDLLLDDDAMTHYAQYLPVGLLQRHLDETQAMVLGLVQTRSAAIKQEAASRELIEKLTEQPSEIEVKRMLDEITREDVDFLTKITEGVVNVASLVASHTTVTIRKRTSEILHTFAARRNLLRHQQALLKARLAGDQLELKRKALASKNTKQNKADYEAQLKIINEQLDNFSQRVSRDLAEIAKAKFGIKLPSSLLGIAHIAGGEVVTGKELAEALDMVFDPQELWRSLAPRVQENSTTKKLHLFAASDFVENLEKHLSASASRLSLGGKEGRQRVSVVDHVNDNMTSFMGNLVALFEHGWDKERVSNYVMDRLNEGLDESDSTPDGTPHHDLFHNLVEQFALPAETFTEVMMRKGTAKDHAELRKANNELLSATLAKRNANKLLKRLVYDSTHATKLGIYTHVDTRQREATRRDAAGNSVPGKFPHIPFLLNFVNPEVKETDSDREGVREEAVANHAKLWEDAAAKGHNDYSYYINKEALGRALQDYSENRAMANYRLLQNSLQTYANFNPAQLITNAMANTKLEDEVIQARWDEFHAAAKQVSGGQRSLSNTLSVDALAILSNPQLGTRLVSVTPSANPDNANSAIRALEEQVKTDRFEVKKHMDWFKSPSNRAKRDKLVNPLLARIDTAKKEISRLKGEIIRMGIDKNTRSRVRFHTAPDNIDSRRNLIGHLVNNGEIIMLASTTAKEDMARRFTETGRNPNKVNSRISELILEAVNPTNPVGGPNAMTDNVLGFNDVHLDGAFANATTGTNGIAWVNNENTRRASRNLPPLTRREVGKIVSDHYINGLVAFANRNSTSVSKNLNLNNKDAKAAEDLIRSKVERIVHSFGWPTLKTGVDSSTEKIRSFLEEVVSDNGMLLPGRKLQSSEGIRGLQIEDIFSDVYSEIEGQGILDRLALGLAAKIGDTTLWAMKYLHHQDARLRAKFAKDYSAYEEANKVLNILNRGINGISGRTGYVTRLAEAEDLLAPTAKAIGSNALDHSKAKFVASLMGILEIRDGSNFYNLRNWYVNYKKGMEDLVLFNDTQKAHYGKGVGGKVNEFFNATQISLIRDIPMMHKINAILEPLLDGPLVGQGAWSSSTAAEMAQANIAAEVLIGNVVNALRDSSPKGAEILAHARNVLGLFKGLADATELTRMALSTPPTTENSGMVERGRMLSIVPMNYSFAVDASQAKERLPEPARPTDPIHTTDISQSPFYGGAGNRMIMTPDAVLRPININGMESTSSTVSDALYRIHVTPNYSILRNTFGVEQQTPRGYSEITDSKVMHDIHQHSADYRTWKVALAAVLSESELEIQNDMQAGVHDTRAAEMAHFLSSVFIARALISATQWINQIIPPMIGIMVKKAVLGQFNQIRTFSAITARVASGLLTNQLQKKLHGNSTITGTNTAPFETFTDKLTQFVQNTNMFVFLRQANGYDAYKGTSRRIVRDGTNRIAAYAGRAAKEIEALSEKGMEITIGSTERLLSMSIYATEVIHELQSLHARGLLDVLPPKDVDALLDMPISDIPSSVFHYAQVKVNDMMGQSDQAKKALIFQNQTRNPGVHSLIRSIVRFSNQTATGSSNISAMLPALWTKSTVVDPATGKEVRTEGSARMKREAIENIVGTIVQNMVFHVTKLYVLIPLVAYTMFKLGGDDDDDAQTKAQEVADKVLAPNEEDGWFAANLLKKTLVGGKKQMFQDWRDPDSARNSAWADLMSKELVEMSQAIPVFGLLLGYSPVQAVYKNLMDKSVEEGFGFVKDMDVADSNLNPEGIRIFDRNSGALEDIASYTAPTAALYDLGSSAVTAARSTAVEEPDYLKIVMYLLSQVVSTRDLRTALGDELKKVIREESDE
jgi:hypothetical protein